LFSWDLKGIKAEVDGGSGIEVVREWIERSVGYPGMDILQKTIKICNFQVEMILLQTN
jgi:hypothetical protein